VRARQQSKATRLLKASTASKSSASASSLPLAGSALDGFSDDDDGFSDDDDGDATHEERWSCTRILKELEQVRPPPRLDCFLGALLYPC
jgi:hypothetical protein